MPKTAWAASEAIASSAFWMLTARNRWLFSKGLILISLPVMGFLSVWALLRQEVRVGAEPWCSAWECLLQSLA
jgi:hypothetical protein